MNNVQKFVLNALCTSLLCVYSNVAFAKDEQSCEDMDNIAIVAVDTQMDFASTEEAKKYHEEQTRLLSAQTIKSRVKYTHGLPVDGANEDFFKQEQFVLAWGREKGFVIVRTADDHPEDSVTFASTHGVAEFSEVNVEGWVSNPDGTITKKTQKQTVWPKHCITKTRGAAWVNRPEWYVLATIPLVKRFVKYQNDIIQHKGQTNESYSAVRDTYGNDLGLIKILDDKKVGGIIIGGLAGGHCVCSTALDLAKHRKKEEHGSFEVVYVLNHTRWLQGTANAVPAYRKGLVSKIREMRDAGITFYVVKEGSAGWQQKEFVEGLCKDAGAQIHTVETMDDLQQKLQQALVAKKANKAAQKAQ